MSSDDQTRYLTTMPTSVRQYRTITVSHDDVDEAETLRYVQDTVSRTIEGQEYKPLKMKIVDPSESESGDQKISVSFETIGSGIKEFAAKISIPNRMTPVNVLYKRYLSSDINTPVYQINLSVSNLSFSGYKSVSFSAVDIDFYNKIAGEVYTVDEFPTMRGVKQ